MRYVKTTLITIIGCSACFAQTEGNAFFSSSTVHEIRFTFHQTNYWDSLEASYTNDYYIKGDVEIDGIMMLDCGVKFKGNSSYNSPGLKKPFKIDFNEYVSGQEYDELKKLNLNNCVGDPTFLREKLMSNFLRDHGLYAPRIHFTNVYINDTLWGLYTAVEEVDVKAFLRNNIGDDRGNLFKGDPMGDLKWYGTSESSYYTKYELKTNETENDWSDLVNFVNVINNTATGSLPAALDTVFDIDNYIHTWAVHSLFSNLDSYMGSGHNYFIYHDSTDNKFNWISWDMNEAFGNFDQGLSVTQLENLSILYMPTPETNRPLHYKMLQESYFEQLLAEAICEYSNYDFSPAAMDPVIDSLANLIRIDVYADPNKIYSDQNFEDNLNDVIGSNTPGLKSFIINRRASVTAELVNYGCYVSIEDNTQLAASVFPNPATDFIQINGMENPEDYQISIYNCLGQQLEHLTPYSNVISLAGIMETGILLLEIKQISTGSKKLIKVIKN